MSCCPLAFIKHKKLLCFILTCVRHRAWKTRHRPTDALAGCPRQTHKQERERHYQLAHQFNLAVTNLGGDLIAARATHSHVFLSSLSGTSF